MYGQLVCNKLNTYFTCLLPLALVSLTPLSFVLYWVGFYCPNCTIFPSDQSLFVWKIRNRNICEIMPSLT